MSAVACDDGGAAAQKKAAAAELPPADAARLLLLGTGELCQSDNNCGKPPIAGACVLGTCFGLLTADSPAGRAVLCDRIEGASNDVRASAEISLLKALTHPDAGRRARTAAAEGLGAVLAAQADGTCGETCEALRKAAASTDPQVASTARRSLANIADPTVLAGLLEDLEFGTPHLACATARALRGYLLGSSSKVAQAALTKAVGSGDLAVSSAARRALRAMESGK